MELIPRCQKLGSVHFDDFKLLLAEKGDCLLWSGGLNPKGKPTYYLNPKFPDTGLSAGRLSWRFLRHELRDSQLVWNTCSHPRCVNPEHASLRRCDQIKIRPLKPRKGEKHPRAKLTNDKVRRIHALHLTGNVTCVEMGRLFGVSTVTISNILNGKAWTHIPLPELEVAA